MVHPSLELLGPPEGVAHAVRAADWQRRQSPGKAPPSLEMRISSLTRNRIFGRIRSPNRSTRLRPACDPPLKAGFVFLGSRLLANQREHSAPGWARSQFI